MEIKTLPIPVDIINPEGNEFIVDMANPHFPTKPDRQIDSSLIFIRNTSLIAKFDFSGCSYSDKKSYLLMYMMKHYRLSVKELNSTWVKIIGWKYGNVNCESILSTDEIENFIEENKELVDELRCMSASIPICAITRYCKDHNIDLVGDVEYSEYCEINGWNFFNLLDIDAFINLVQVMTDIPPKYYTNYFVMDNSLMDKIYQKFPYMGLLDLMLNPEEGDKFIKDIEDAAHQNMS